MKKSFTKRPVLWIFFLTIALIVSGGLIYINSDIRLDIYRTFTRQDGAYRVEIMRRPVLLGMMPGQSGDAPGKAQLRDRNNNLLAQVDLPMVQLVEGVDWSNDHVYIPLYADWDLQALQPSR